MGPRVEPCTSVITQRRYYTCLGAEEFHLETSVEALAELIDLVMVVDEGGTLEAIEETVRRVSPITVRCYLSREVHPSWVAAEALRLTGAFGESFSDEFGDPNGGGAGLTPPVLAHFVETSIAPLLTELLVEHGYVWMCDLEGEKVYTAEQVLELFERRHAQKS